MFIALLSFSRSLATKSVSLNNVTCMIRPNLINLYPLELKYHQFLITLDKCSGSCNCADDLSSKICVPSKKKDVNVEVFKTITNRNEAKTMVKHISCSIVQIAI